LNDRRATDDVRFRDRNARDLEGKDVHRLWGRLAPPELPTQHKEYRMVIMRSVELTVRARLQADPGFRDAMLGEVLDLIQTNDLDVGRAVLRQVIQATLGFDRLGVELGLSARDLVRVFGRRGRPQAQELLRTHALLTRLV
jgi:hypothetical protein